MAVLGERDNASLIDALWPRRQFDFATMSLDEGDMDDAGAHLFEEGIGAVSTADVWHCVGRLVVEDSKSVSMSSR